MMWERALAYSLDHLQSQRSTFRFLNFVFSIKGSHMAPTPIILSIWSLVVSSPVKQGYLCPLSWIHSFIPGPALKQAAATWPSRHAVWPLSF